MTTLTEALPKGADPDELLDAFTTWVADRGITPYPAQEEALLELYAGSNVILKTPTGSGKSLVALGLHAAALATGGRSYYTAPIKALVSEKFFALSRDLGADNVGLLTGDASVNPSAPVICCTAEILANLALRDGEGLDVASVCMDEFHFYADPDRGWAWQVPLLMLPHAQFLLLSATLGDVTFFRDDLTKRTGRETAVIANAERPIPLVYDYRHTAVHTTLEDLLGTERAPVYVVHFTQAAAVERAQALMSVNMCSREEKDAIAAAIGKFRFGPGFGQSLSRFVRHGIGVHHAGLLPKYRLLVEKLAQEGLLKVICGTDTLGVGINVPIRTVLLTQLCKYDGTKTRILSAREFHQVAGRAGRAGFDTSGTVWAQAPEHVIENEQAAAKAADDPKKKRKLVKAKPPERGFVNWTEDTFTKLIAAVPEQLTSSFHVSHSMLLNVLDREDDEGPGILKRLLLDNHEPRSAQRRHIRRAISIFRSLEKAGVVTRKDGRVRVNTDLQQDFRLNQPLSPFVLESVSRLDRTSEAYPLDVLSMVEATLENPEVILRAQLSKLKGEKVAELKAAGVEYEERMAILETLEHPKPLREFTYDLFDAYRLQHPWVEDHNIRPKSVARDMYEKLMTFPDFVGHYQLARSEGLVLRYLTDAYKGMVQTVPEDAKTDDVYDLTEWLRETVRQTDSSLLDEWERLRDGVEVEPPPLPTAPTDVTANERAFRLMVRNEVFRQVELLARRSHPDTPDLSAYWAEHDSIGIGGDARATASFQLTEASDAWRVRQVLHDPDGDLDWAAHFEVDLAASDEEGTPVVRLVGVSN
ncbi:MAG: box helicase-like [Actinomycetia bacterium]|nr:box helicase-like [Actinomycetes bacterium]